MEIKELKLSQLEVNKGQLYGLPKNPRFIRDERFEALKKSIEDAPEMLSLREIMVYPLENTDNYIIIGGNMRYRACKDLGYKTVPCKVIPLETPVQKLREYTIKDNESFGNTDWDIIANEWDTEELGDWGMELPDFAADMNGEGEGEEKPQDLENPYSQTISTPIYEITGENPPIESLIDTKRMDEILAAIEKSSVDEAHKKMLRIAAYRHAVIDFSKMAEFYAHADKEVQELMEDNALVIIDFNKAIEKGYVQLTKKLQDIYDNNPVDMNEIPEEDVVFGDE